MLKKIGFVLLVVAGSLSPHLLLAQLNITGRVMNAANQPVPGASVSVSKSTIGTQTDSEGRFRLNVPPGSTLVISYVGYKSTPVKVENASSEIQVLLKEDLGNLEEVVVSGLATSVKRSNLANAIATVSNKQLVGGSPAQTFDGALSGKVPGAYINSNTGAPGGGMSVKLRGITSVFGNSQPLYVVDGVFLDNSSFSAGLNTITTAQSGGLPTSTQDNASNRIADINPQDIETVEVLKGASAAALYGSKASAGVIIITTKKGKSGKQRISFSQDVGQTSIINYLGSRPLTRDIVIRQGWSVSEYDAAVAANKIYDYEKEMYGNKGLLLNTRLSMSGGSDKTSFYIGGSYKNEDGIIRHTGYKNYSIRLNLDHKITDKISVGFTSNYINTSSDRSLTNNDNLGVTLGVALSSTPNFTELHQDASGNWPRNNYAASNPLETIEKMKNNERTNRIVTGANLNAILQQSSASTTKLILRGGVDYYNLKTNAYFPGSLQFMENTLKGASIQGNTNSTSINWAALLVNNFTLNDNLGFTTTGGYTLEAKDQDFILNTATQLIGTQTNINQGGALTATQVRAKNQEKGIFVQEEMSFHEFLTATAGVRFDRSTNNGDPDKYFTYPKAGLAVNISKMAFWNSNLINNLKIRGAYGQSGNFPTYGAKFSNLANSNIGGNPGSLVPTTIGNSSILPEKQVEFETGLDISLLEGRINFEGTYYIKKIYDMLLVQNIPRSSGYTYQNINGGTLRNTGIELSVNASPIKSRNVTWTTTINFWKNKSLVTQLDVPAFALGGFSNALGTFYIEEGKSATQLVGSRGTEGFGPIGDAEPDFQMGFLNEVTFLKNFTLRVFIHWKQGGDNINLTQLLTDLGGTSKDFDEDKDKNGVADGQDRINALGTTAVPFIQDASYLKFREIGLYYNVPLGNIKTIKGLRLGVSGNNLFRITHYQGYDPEVANFSSIGASSNGISTGVDVTPFPSSKRLNVHLALDF